MKGHVLMQLRPVGLRQRFLMSISTGHIESSLIIVKLITILCYQFQLKICLHPLIYALQSLSSFLDDQKLREFEKGVLNRQIRKRGNCRQAGYNTRRCVGR